MPENHVTRQLIAYCAFATAAILATFLVGLLEIAPFQRFFGSLPPLITVTAIAAMGGGAIFWLEKQGWIARKPAPDLRLCLRIGALAVLMAVPTILVDRIAPFASDINVAAPAGLLFYLAIAQVVEALFHLIPLAVFLWIGSRLFRADATSGGIFWTLAIAVALLEPGFQLMADQQPDIAAWRDAYLGLHLFAFNLVQLALLRCRGYTAAITFRLTYYLMWHILWGTLRLDMSFLPPA